MSNTAIAARQTPALQKYKQVTDLLNSDAVQAAIARALPRHMTAERMIRVAMTAIQKTPKLAECDQRSLVNAIVQASELGLEPSTPLGEAYLIPYFNGKTKRQEAQLMPGYRGLIKLARQSGQVQGIYAEIVYEHDHFAIEYGLNKDLTHRPALDLEDRGAMIGAYAVAKFKDGYTDFEYMNAAEINAIRKRSKSGDSGPWVTDTGEMWKKTPIRRLTKRLPLSIEDAAFRKAIEIDTHYDIALNNVAPLELNEAPAAEPITEQQRMALVDASKASGSDLTAIVHSFGFDLLADITVDKYDEILSAVSTSPATPATIDQPEEETPSADPPASEAVDAEESNLVDLVTASTEGYRALTGEAKLEANKFLGTKTIAELTAKKLQEFHDKFVAG